MSAKIKFDDAPRMWDRQPGESDQAWEQFQMFMETRDRHAVVKAYYGDNEEHYTSGKVWVLKMSKDNKWNARRDAYDSWIAKHRDTRTALLVRHEIALIAQRRSRLFATLYRKVKAVVDAANEKDPKTVRTALTLVRMLDDLFRKVEEGGAYGAVTQPEQAQTELREDKQVLRDHLAQIAKLHADHMAKQGEQPAQPGEIVQ